MDENIESTDKAGVPVASVRREAQVIINLGDEHPISLTDEQARQVYSQLRRWYGRGK